MVEMSSAPLRKATGRFVSQNPRDPFALYEVVRVVAIKAAALVNAAAAAGAIPITPDEVTMVQWNAAREYVEGFGVIQSAAQICALLPDRDGKPFRWRALLKLAFDERSIERVHQARQGVLDDPI